VAGVWRDTLGKNRVWPCVSGHDTPLRVRNAERMPGHYREAQREWLSLARENIQA